MDGAIKVLLIEDDALIRRSVIEFFSLVRPDWQIDEASTISEASEKLQRNEYDLCISDCHLPDGLACDLFLRIEKEVPVLVVSGEVNESMLEKAKKYPLVRQVLKKPVNFQKLLQAADSILSG